jgi:hypothetical protein
LDKLLAHLEVELYIGFQCLESLDSIFESSQSHARQFFAVKQGIDGFAFFLRKHVSSHVKSFILWEEKVLNTFYPHSRDSRVLRSSSEVRKTRLKRKQPQ